MADSYEKSCILVSEFGRVCERRKLRVNVSKSKVMRCSTYGNGGRMHVILNGEPLEEVDCFKYLGSQVAADGGCEMDVVHRMNEGYRAWVALKSVLSNSGLGIIIIIIIKISYASPSGKNRTFTKSKSNPTSTCATEKKQTLKKQTTINCSLKSIKRTRVKHRGREIIPHANMCRQKTSSKLGRPTPWDLKLTRMSHNRSTSMSYPLTGWRQLTI